MTTPTAVAADTTAPPVVSTWAPLAIRAYRALWIAGLVSNIGTWMQTVGAQWLLVDAPNAAALVALVQTASTLPVLLLALPAGVLADVFERRRLLIAYQSFMFVVGVALTALTIADQLPPALLLTFTFLLGCGQALWVPAYQSFIPELVPRAHLPSASALGSVSINSARAIGPAIAGLLIAQTGVAFVFALNALTFLGFAVVLIVSRAGTSTVPRTEPERFLPALRVGSRFVRHSLVLRRILLRSAMFVVPGSVMWALLPVFAHDRLELDATGYGVLLGAVGVGAVSGAFVLPYARRHLSPSGLLALASCGLGSVLIVIANVRSAVVVALVLLLAGAAWISVLSSMNASLQMFLPHWVRGRGLSMYQVVVFGGQAVGAFAWGQLAHATTVPTAFVVAGGLLLVGAATLPLLPLRDVAGMDRSSAAYWDEPQLVVEPHPDAGPVRVLVTYDVPADNHARFLEAMSYVRRSRLRTGATAWDVYRDGEHPDEFVETYVVPSWGEHMRQHEGRLTGADQAREEAARSLCRSTPRVQHLLPPVDV